MIDLSPEEFRELGYRAIDMITEQLASVRDNKTRQPVPPALREKLMQTPLADEPVSAETLLTQFQQDVMPYPMGNNSPRFFAWINSTVAPFGILAELLAASHNASVAGGDHSAVYIEHGVLNWFKEFFGYHASATGLLVSGGSMANLNGLAVMRHVVTEGNIRTYGFHNSPRMVLYTSTQGHSCIQKAVETLGFGNDSLRRIPVDAEYRFDVAALKAQIKRDREDGFLPVCVAASAGTVNTGAIDPFDALADVCQEENMWFHVDGAYGGVGILAPEVTPLFKGIERADSIAVDPHKWLYVPIECGCVLVKDAQAMRNAFSVMPAYLRDDRTLPWFSEYGVQQTRGFRALKLWMVLQQVGKEGYRQLIQHDIAMSKALQNKLHAHPDFELVAAGHLSICTFVYRPTNVTPDRVASLNRELVSIVQSEGRAFITSTELNGKVVLRACIVNFRTTEADLDELLEAIAEAGQRVLHPRFDAQ